MKKQKMQHNIMLPIIIFCLSSIVFLLLFSWSTSPLYDFIGVDSSVFKLIGRMTREGMIPYKDFFDHKGPIIVLVEYLGYGVFGTKTGVMFIQTIFLTCTLYGIYVFLRLFIDKKIYAMLCTIFSLLVYGVYITSIYEGGNLAEEYCLPFLMWSQYFAVKFMKDNGEDEGHNHWYAMFYGMTFMVGAFTRLTNALPLCIEVLIILFILIKKKKWKNIIENMLFFILGMAIIFLPVVLWFSTKNALGDMLYCTFVYNFKYAALNETILSQEEIISHILRYLSPLIITAVIGLIHIKEYSYISWMLILQSLVGILFQLNSAMYIHYLMIYVPTIILGIVLLYLGHAKIKKVLILGVISTILLNNLLNVKDCILIHTYTCEKDWRNEINKLAAEIPTEDRDKVIAYNISCQFYLESGISPCYRNFHLQDFQCAYDEEMANSFRCDIESLEAQYIVVSVDNNNTLEDIILNNYKEEKRTEHFILLKRIG